MRADTTTGVRERRHVGERVEHGKRAARIQDAARARELEERQAGEARLGRRPQEAERPSGREGRVLPRVVRERPLAPLAPRRRARVDARAQRHGRDAERRGSAKLRSGVRDPPQAAEVLDERRVVQGVHLRTEPENQPVEQARQRPAAVDLDEVRVGASSEHGPAVDRR